MITPTVSEHRDALLSIIAASGQFDDDGIAHVAGTLDAHLAHPGEAIWLTALQDGPVGVAYCAPEPVTVGTWNLLMLWLAEGYEGRGHGQALVEAVETRLREVGARLLIVETSGLPEFENARRFYDASGFTLEGRVASFFDAGDDKLIYTKALRGG